MREEDAGRETAKMEEELINYQGADRVVSFKEMQAELKERKLSGAFYSGLGGLDKLVDGFRPGELIVVSGRPKSGKTLFLQSLTEKFSLENQQPLWFSYELQPREFLGHFKTLPDGYMPRRMELSNIWWLERRVWEAQLKYESGIVMIDHLHYLVDMSRMRNPSLEIGTVLRKLKGIAIRYNQVIFLVCHIGKIKKGQEPEGEDIRDSSFCLQEPDTILMLWRVLRVKEKDVWKDVINQARLKVVLTRRTGVMDKVIKIIKVGDRLEELEEHQKDENKRDSASTEDGLPEETY